MRTWCRRMDMVRVQGSSLGAGRARGSYLMEDQLPRPLSMVRRLVEGLGGHQQPWSIHSNLAFSAKRTGVEKVVEHTCKVRRGTRDSKGKGRQGGKSRAFKSGQALPRSRLKYTGVGRPPWTKVWRSFHAVWVRPEYRDRFLSTGASDMCFL